MKLQILAVLLLVAVPGCLIGEPDAPDDRLVPPANLPDPELYITEVPADPAWTVEYQRYAGELFVDGISPDDVRQGAIGDCYFMAALASVAYMQPGTIRNMIHVNEDGTFTVTFYESHVFGDPTPIEITVDRDLPIYRWGMLAYAHHGDTPELWPAILEKAYAAWHGGYDDIGKGGSMPHQQAVLTALLGALATWDIVTPLADNNGLHDQIAANLRDGRSMATNTNLDVFKNHEAYPGSHYYSILGVKRDDAGTPYVWLRNPWGYREPTNADGYPLDGRDDGQFWLRIEDYKYGFLSMSSGRVKQ